MSQLVKNGLLEAAVFAVMMLFMAAVFSLLPIVERTERQDREWKAELAKQASPFSCGKCGGVLSAKMVYELIEIGNVKYQGTCPYCGALLDSTEFRQERYGDVGWSDISEYNRALDHLHWQDTPGFALNWDGFALVCVIGFLAFLVFAGWIETVKKGKRVDETGPTSPKAE